MTKRMMSVLAVLIFAGLAGMTRAQEIAMSEIKFNKGQSIQPAFEGWMKNPDGSFSLWFGYLNRNYEETPDIPIGANNGFGAGGEDLGQPTHFLTRRQPWVFKVTVPADWPKDKDVVWTVTANGTTLKAYGSLWPVWEVDEKIMSSDNGGRTARAFGEPENKAPKIVSLSPDQSVAVGTPVTLTMATTDDGLPTPEMRSRGNGGGGGRGGRGAGRGGRGGAGGGPGGAAADPNSDTSSDSGIVDPNADAGRGTFRVKWIEFKAPAGGTAKFVPAISPVLGADGKPTATDGKGTTRVTFDKAGTYVVRGYAMDPDSYFVYQDVKVTVTPPAQTGR
jgi:uncharacterized membrane protein YgcG